MPISHETPEAEDYMRIARAIRYLETHAHAQPGLADLAAHLGLSEAHFHRMFHRWAGVTPKDFLQALTLARAKPLLRSARSVLETSHAVGLSGSGRLHDLFVSLEALTPGEYKRGGAGVTIGWGEHSTPLGAALFATTDRGLCGLAFIEPDAPEASFSDLHARWPQARFVHAPEQTASAAEEVTRRMRGEPFRPLSLLLKGTPFQLKVWEALLALPEGATVAYGTLAAAAGAPGAARAVGSAMAANPIGYLIPCHRVIRSTGGLGDYRWGLARKQCLLALESARATS